MNRASTEPAKGRLTFQQLIFTLQDYWARQGCVILQPYDMEMGAGTFHTATFLRSIGPEPWNAAYVQPSRRPTDGRYGENPNRLQHYYQYQVAMKPSPKDIQQRYLGSLEVLGLDLHLHDIRFVEDNWESPTLGAWGLGWEVWLNGMEVTQFTYFQQAGFRLSRLFLELTLAKADGTYRKLLKQLARIRLLLIDDWGLEPMTPAQRNDLMEIRDDRHGHSSCRMISQLPTDQWYASIGDNTLADAILDRLMHNAHHLTLKGESMRKVLGQLTEDEHLG